jgi:hypothetical protein
MSQRETWPALSHAAGGKECPRFCFALNATGLLGIALLGLVPMLAGCAKKLPEGALVLTQTPTGMKAASSPQDILDQRYPAGSRVVLARPPYKASDARVLSHGLVAAGSPVVCWSGKRICFVGKASASGVWQIYETKASGGRPKAISAMEGGAMDPAIIANGDIVFSSPVPKVGQTWKTAKPAALYVQGSDSPPRRLTFGAGAAVEPTVLRDGRILFVSAHPAEDSAAPPNLGLFTVNTDGTELTAFALDRDGGSLVHRPRELMDGRVGFLAAAAEAHAAGIWAESVRLARPFASRARLFSFPTSNCRSVEPEGDRALLACLEMRGLMGRSMSGSFGVYRLAADAKALGEPLFDDPAWNDIEATHVGARLKPMGHISAMNPTKKTGTILCLNANFTRHRQMNGIGASKAERVRVLAGGTQDQARPLGDVRIQADGSFMAEVPADTPLGFEALDAEGRVLRRLPPAIWVRPGENRSCLGCHEPYNRSPRNLRPIAAFFPPVALDEKPPAVAKKTQ